jgi:DNA repair exonuclease SbcCD ATPase subunit/DNA repair exonuclease SbcCD nuclease subunit
MGITSIQCNISKADKIYHISDVHIRTLKRHREYKQVFSNLFEYINTTKTENSIAVITGDIVHSKLEMSPELIRMLTNFFNGFTLPTIVILGNHDMNLNNMHREDALSPVIDMIQNPNIYFVKENGLFDFAGIRWNHMAVDVEPAKYIKGHDFTADYRKIALHHGAVNSAVTDIGYEISNEQVNISMFDAHDITLLGDIHKPAQFLNSEKTIAYPGSLIQQSHGEAMHHGILVWDVETCSAEFVEIKNDYGYVTFEVNGTTLINPPKVVPPKPRIRIKFSDTSAADIKKFITLLRSKYDVQDISIQRTTQNNSGVTDSGISIGNVRDIEYQNKLITDYVERVFPQATADELDAIRHINRSINSKLPQLDSVRHVTWTPISFEFENMFSYGTNNIIDFTKVTDVTGLFAPNTSGKSSLLDAITYTIFDKCSKTGKAHEVLNNKKTSFKGIFKFQLHDTIYTIEREGIQQKNGHVKVIVNFYSDTENLNGEERSDTNKNIRKYLGSYDDFILTAFSLQNDSNNFINKSQRERKDLLSQFLDITVFEQLYLFANDEIRETAGKLKEYKKTDFSVTITAADDIINQNKDFIIECEQQESVKNTGRNDIQNTILTLIESKQPTTYNGPSVDVLNKTETRLTADIESLHTQVEQFESKIKTINSEISQHRKQLKTFNVTQLQAAYTELQKHRTELTGLNEQIYQTEEIINAKQEKIKHLSQHEYDPNCQYCTSNVFVQHALEAQNTIGADRSILTQLTDTQTCLQHDIDSLLYSETQLNEYSSIKTNLDTVLLSQLERTELQLRVIENELQAKESELETVYIQHEQFTANESAIEHNALIDTQISQYKQQIDTINSELKVIADSIKQKHGEIEVAKTNRSNALHQLEIYSQLETEYKAYEYYLQSVKRDGIPYELVSTAIPKIESEINNVLNQIVDFNLVLQADGKNINGYIIYDEDNMWPLELTSGMERFISSLAIRIGLINVSALPRPNFIAIDEGWGVLDSDHISSVVNLFEYLRIKFDFAIIISHVDSMRDMVDSLLEVNKIDNYSQIIHT